MADYSSSRLDFHRPPKLLNLVEIIGGLFILILAIVSIPYNYANISELIEFFERLVDRGYWDYDLDQIMLVLYAIATIIAGLFFLRTIVRIFKVGLFNAVKAFRELIIPWMPARIPTDFRDYQEVLKGYKERTLSIYKPLDAFISSIFGENTMFLSPLRRTIFADNVSHMRKRLTRLIGAGVMIACSFGLFALADSPATRDFFSDISRELASAMRDSDVRSTTIIPFIIIVVLQIVLAGIEFFVSLMMVPRRQPNTVATEASEHYRGFGHPAQIISRMHILAQPLKWGEFDNRIFDPPIEERASHAVGDVGSFSGRILIEQQPAQHEKQNDFPAYLQLLLGWWLAIVGYYLILFQILPVFMRGELRSEPFIFAPVFVLFMGLAANTAIRNGSRYIDHATTLLKAGIFKSIAILIELNGNLSRADISVGKAETDSIGSSNVVVRSDFVARFWVAELISEMANLRNAKDKRELLALEQSLYGQEWIDYFTAEINTLREEGVKPVGVDFTAHEVEEIVRANVAVTGMKKGAEVKASLPEGEYQDDVPLIDQIGTARQLKSTAEDTPPPAPLDSSAEYKECPDCAEMVRARARKCRFCGYRFEED